MVSTEYFKTFPNPAFDSELYSVRIRVASIPKNSFLFFEGDWSYGIFQDSIYFAIFTHIFKTFRIIL